MLLPLGRHHWFGADKLDHPLRHPPRVEVKTFRGVSRDCPTRQPLRRMEQRRQARVNQQAVKARGSSSLQAVVRAGGAPPQGGRQLKVRIHQHESQEGRQDRQRRSKRVIRVKVKVPPHQLRGRPVSPHILRGVVPERAVKGRLGRHAVRHPGVQGIHSASQAKRDVAVIESDTWLTGYPRSQDPAPHKSLRISLSLTALQCRPDRYCTTTLVVIHLHSTNKRPLGTRPARPLYLLISGTSQFKHRVLRGVRRVAIPPGVRTHLHGMEDVCYTHCSTKRCYQHSKSDPFGLMIGVGWLGAGMFDCRTGCVVVVS